MTTHEEQSDNLCAGSNMPKVNDRIRYRLPEEDWVVAVVTGRGGKATGKNKYYFNIHNIDNGGELGIHLDKAEFQLLTESVSVQGLNEQSCGENNDNVEVERYLFQLNFILTQKFWKLNKKSLRTGLILVLLK